MRQFTTALAIAAKILFPVLDTRLAAALERARFSTIEDSAQPCSNILSIALRNAKNDNNPKS